MELTVNIDRLYDVDAYSVEINFHGTKQTVILDNPVGEVEDGL